MSIHRPESVRRAGRTASWGAPPFRRFEGDRLATSTPSVGNTHRL